MKTLRDRDHTPIFRRLKTHRLSTPLSSDALFALCARSQGQVALLENPGEPSSLRRHSFFCSDVYWVFRSKRARCWSGPPEDVRPRDLPPLEELERCLGRFRAQPLPHDDDLPPLTGGAVGYLGYELLYELESIPDTGRDDLGWPDSELIFCALVIALDHVTGASWVIATGFGDDGAAADDEATRRLTRGLAMIAPAREQIEPLRRRRVEDQKLCAEVLIDRPQLREAHLIKNGIAPCTQRVDYLQSVQTILSHIRAGDAFEVCLTQRFDTQTREPGIDLYCTLRAINPAPMAAYLQLSAGEILCASPERFLCLDRNRRVETRPIKGTRPRGATEAEDRANQRDLAEAEKDRAENMMIVDLSRNDLGRVCEFGTVRVERLCDVEAHEFTWQMVSTIVGRLRPELGPIDLLRATFPGGSMTGAPKVEAMKIIDRLEPTKRGVYSGGVGYLDLDGALDLNIVIRTLIKTGSALSFHVGGTVVADSDPDDEYQETLDKAQGLVCALDVARRRGLVPDKEPSE